MTRRYIKDPDGQLDPHWPGPSCWCGPYYVRSRVIECGKTKFVWKLEHKPHVEEVPILTQRSLSGKYSTRGHFQEETRFPASGHQKQKRARIVGISRKSREEGA